MQVCVNILLLLQFLGHLGPDWGRKNAVLDVELHDESASMSEGQKGRIMAKLAEKIKEIEVNFKLMLPISASPSEPWENYSVEDQRNSWLNVKASLSNRGETIRG